MAANHDRAKQTNRAVDAVREEWASALRDRDMAVVKAEVTPGHGSSSGTWSRLPSMTLSRAVRQSDQWVSRTRGKESMVLILASCGRHTPR